jgi:hypothetical protein
LPPKALAPRPIAAQVKDAAIPALKGPKCSERRIPTRAATDPEIMAIRTSLATAPMTELETITAPPTALGPRPRNISVINAAVTIVINQSPNRSRRTGTGCCEAP